MTRTMVFNFAGYSGWHLLASLLPKKAQARFIAKRWMKSVNNPDPKETRLVINLPWGSYQIVDAAGHVIVCPRENVPSGSI